MKTKSVLSLFVSAIVLALQLGCASHSWSKAQNSPERSVQSEAKSEPVHQGLPRPMRSGGY